jgi:DUF2934 family protein
VSRHPLADDAMLKYFLSTLDVRVSMIGNRLTRVPDECQKVSERAYAIWEREGRPNGKAEQHWYTAERGIRLQETQKEALLAHIKKQLETFFARHSEKRMGLVDDAWCEAYRLERLMALIEPPDTLFLEVQRRLDEADDENVPHAARLRAAALDFVDRTKSPPALKDGSEVPLRDMFLGILEDLHWTLQRKFYSRPLRKQATGRLVWIGLIACGLFVLPYAYLYIRLWLAGTGANFVLPFESWAWLPLWTALTSGFFGAMFSRLLFLQWNRDVFSLGALKDAGDFWSICLRGAVGMSGAVVVYCLLQSGVVLGGGLFPKLRELGLEQIRFPITHSANIVPLRLILPNRALALLVVWCFLAGFSERLVPSILKTTETSLTEKPK